jgi:type II secretory pathway pseudopilin PulG
MGENSGGNMSNPTAQVQPDAWGGSGWLRVMRGLASGSLIIFVIAAVVAAMIDDPAERAKNLVVLLTTAPFWLPYLWIFIRLKGKTARGQKKGLALGVAFGSCTLILACVLAATSDGWLWRAGFAIYALLQFLLVLSAAKSYYAMDREPGDRWVLVSRLAVVSGGFFILIVAGITIPCMVRSQVAANEASTVAAVRTINTAQSDYAKKHPEKGFAATFSELRATRNDDIIDQRLASGKKAHYTFVIVAGPADSRGRITKYSVIARPERFGKDGRRCFFTDESGVIRFTSEDRPPTVLDAAL